MVAPLVLSVLLLLLVSGLAWAVLSHERVDETERWNRAREITSSWADPSGQQQLAHVPDAERSEQQR
jgi:hypothetical protein